MRDAETPKRKPAKKTPRKPTGYTAEFEQWWAVYPNKRDKHAASVKYAAALRVTTHSTLVTAATRYADEVRGKDPEHIKYGKTWLHQRSWEDYADAAPAAPPTRDGAREWLLAEHAAGRVAEIERRTGLRYQRPDLPDDVSGRDAIERWLIEHRQQWITAHHQTIIDRLTTRNAS